MSEEAVAVVTGASQGIGREVAQQLAAAGRDVVMVARNTPRLFAAVEYVKSSGSPSQVVAIPADLSRMTEVRRLAEEITRRFPSVNVIVHCAAVILPQREVTDEGLEATFATNVVAPFLLSHLLFDSLRRSAPSRIIFFYGGGRGAFDLNDLMSDRKYNGWIAYNQTKNADVMIALELGERWRNTGVAVNCVFPGLVKTEILRGIPLYFRVLLPLARPILRTPSDGARVAVWAATAPERAGTSGKLFGSFTGDPRREFRLPRVARDRGRRQQLFARLQELTGVQPSARPLPKSA